jgi:hypothetical protein
MKMKFLIKMMTNSCNKMKRIMRKATKDREGKFRGKIAQIIYKKKMI